jgi:cytochrome c oxidase cbb3-type subunit IV
MIELNDLRIAVTLLSLFVFIGIVAWAMARRNHDRFAEAARLPFADEARDEANDGARHE